MAHPPSIYGIPKDISCDSHLLNTLWASSTLLPHMAYMSTRLHPANTSASQPLWILCSWACLPSSSAPKLAQVLTTRTKVNLLLGVVPSWLYFLENSTIFSCCPAFTYLASFPFHEKLTNCVLPGAMEAKLCSHPWEVIVVSPHSRVHLGYQYEHQNFLEVSTRLSIFKR